MGNMKYSTAYSAMNRIFHFAASRAFDSILNANSLAPANS